MKFLELTQKKGQPTHFVAGLKKTIAQLYSKFSFREIIITMFLLLTWFFDWITIADSRSPNIVFFLTDDWGFNDVGYHLNTDTQTPFIDSLAQDESLIIEKYYAMPLCTQTRAAFLTGRHPMRYGLQEAIISYESNYALTKKEVLLSQEFQTQGYKTHLVGKWHLGYMTWDYTPTYRFFDTFLGYYGAALYYYEHTGSDSDGYEAFDLHYNKEYYDVPHKNSLDIWSEYCQEIITEQSQSQSISNNINYNDEPFFLYIAWQGSHVPSESDKKYFDLYSKNLTNEEISEQFTRLTFQAQTTQTDRLFKSIIENLKESGIWNDTIVVFSSDNGAENGYGDNGPLRGKKGTILEGGVRQSAFITGGYIPDEIKGKVFDEYPIHVTDWYPTLLYASELKLLSKNDGQTLDGKNIWKLLMTATKDSRNYFRYRQNYFKSSKMNLIEDESDEIDEIYDSFYLENDFDKISELYDGDLDELLSITRNREMLINVDSYNCSNEICGALIYGGRWKIVYNNNRQLSDDESCFWERTFETSTYDILGCGGIPSDVNTSNCLCMNKICLFDLVNDPCEYYDVSHDSDDNVKLTQKLYLLLKDYYDIQTYPLMGIIGDVNDTSIVKPRSHNGTIGWWAPWDKTDDWKDLQFEKVLDTFYIAHYEQELYNHHDIEKDSHSTIYFHFFIVLILMGAVMVNFCDNDKSKGTQFEYQEIQDHVEVNIDEHSPILQHIDSA